MFFGPEPSTNGNNLSRLTLYKPVMILLPSMCLFTFSSPRVTSAAAFPQPWNYSGQFSLCLFLLNHSLVFTPTSYSHVLCAAADCLHWSLHFLFSQRHSEPIFVFLVDPLSLLPPDTVLLVPTFPPIFVPWCSFLMHLTAGWLPKCSAESPFKDSSPYVVAVQTVRHVLALPFQNWSLYL